MFDPAPLAGLPPAIALHLGGAMAALLIGPISIYRQRRDRLHRIAGYAWVLAMAGTAVSSFLIDAFVLPIAGGFGAIHLLSVWVLLNLLHGVCDARAGRIAAHRARMHGLYWQGLGLAGVLTILPGRTLNEVLLPDRPDAGVWIAALGVAALVAGPSLARWLRRRPSPG
jgi:uncharacterized membrane protein